MLEQWIPLVATSAVLVSAAVSDVRMRTVSDAHWIAIGLICTMCQIIADPMIPTIVFSVGSLSLMAYMFLDEGAVRIGTGPFLAASIVMFVASSLCGGRYSGYVSAVMAVAILIMYRFGLVRGGADAKALLVLSFSFPLYPVTDAIPLLWAPLYPAAYVFNPAFSVLFVSLFVSILIVPFLGGIHPVMSVEEAERRFVWPAEDVVDGHTVRIGAPEDPARVYARLKAAGVERIRVTPMIPFILPIAISFLLVTVLGSPLMMLVQ